jgi:hypothetical protein
MAEPASVMVTIDNTAPMITAEDMLYVMTGGMATISATLSEAESCYCISGCLYAECSCADAFLDGRRWPTVTADVTALNEGMPTLISCTDAYPDGRRWRYGIRRRGHDHC